MSRRRAVLVAAGVVIVIAVAFAVAATVYGTGGGTGTVTTPFLSYSPPPGWRAARPDPAAKLDASTLVSPTLVGTVHGPRYTCGGEEFLRGFAAAALLPADPTASAVERADRVVHWFAATAFSAVDGTSPHVTLAPLRTVRVPGPDGPVDGTVTEAIVRTAGGRDDCSAAAGRVLVLAAPTDGGDALLLVAGDTEGGPAVPAAADPSTLDAVVESVRLTT